MAGNFYFVGQVQSYHWRGIVILWFPFEFVNIGDIVARIRTTSYRYRAKDPLSDIGFGRTHEQPIGTGASNRNNPPIGPDLELEFYRALQSTYPR